MRFDSIACNCELWSIQEYSPQCRCVRVLQFQRDQIAAGHETLRQRARPRAVVVQSPVVAGARHAALAVARHQRGEVLAVARHDRFVVGIAFTVELKDDDFDKRCIFLINII